MEVVIQITIQLPSARITKITIKTPVRQIAQIAIILTIPGVILQEPINYLA
jgi:hypothetical protein